MLSFVFVLHNSGVEQSVVLRIVVRREMKKTILGGLDPVVGIKNARRPWGVVRKVTKRWRQFIQKSELQESPI